LVSLAPLIEMRFFLRQNRHAHVERWTEVRVFGNYSSSSKIIESLLKVFFRDVGRLIVEGIETLSFM
jgi:hypothetical protein